MTYDDYRTLVHSSNSLAEIDKALADALRTLSGQPGTSRTAAAEMRGERANWLLRRERYDEAIAAYAGVEQEFRSAKATEGLLTAMAGRARALSRSGHYQEAVGVFEAALKEAGDSEQLSNLLIGLASAHLLEGTTRRDPVDQTLIGHAIKAYRKAINSSSVHHRDRANARLGLARALGESGDQKAAMDEFDRAVAELAHIGSPSAKLLMENRDVFVEGGWRSIGLA
jgi:tetratricopeptide (TPR) repeat protein